MKVSFLVAVHFLLISNCFSQSGSLRISEIKSIIATGNTLERKDPRETLKLYLNTEKKLHEGRYANKDYQEFFLELAYFYFRQGLYAEALQMVDDMEQHAAINFHKYYIVGSIVNSALKNYYKSIDYNTRYLNWARVNRDTSEIIVANLNIANDYILLQQPRKVFDVLAKIQDIIAKGTFYDQSTFFHNLGVACRLNGEYDRAEKYLRRSYELDQKYSTSKEYDITMDFLELGHVYERKHKYKEAIILYDSAAKLLSNYSDADLRLKIYRAIYSVCDKLGNSKKGFEYSLNYIRMSDSVFSVGKVESLGKMDMESTLLAKQREDQKKLNTDRRLQYGAVFCFIVAVTLAIFFASRHTPNRRLIRSSIFIMMLLFFEFLLAVLEPFLNSMVGSTPIYVLTANFGIALLFVPVQRKLESWFAKRGLIEKKSRKSNE